MFVIVWITVIRKGGRSYEAVGKKEYEGGQRRTNRKINQNQFCLKYAMVKHNAGYPSEKLNNKE